MSFAERGEDQAELISFRIAEQEYCIEVASVREIRGWTAATPLPHAPAEALGIINLRGTVLPVFDLKRRLGFGAAEICPRSVVIVIEQGARLIGVLVDEVSEIITIAMKSVHASPKIGEAATVLQGIIPKPDGMVSWLSMRTLFADENGISAAAHSA
jgi:purine-binding chemotaxis protein CheW